MKRAVILHGTDGAPEKGWLMWLKQKLEAEGYEVWLPLLPNNHVPNWRAYNDFLLDSDWDFTDNLVVGHSSGAVSVLNLLMEDRCPQIRFGALVSAWKSGAPENWEDTSQFAFLFHQEGFDFAAIRQKADKLAFLHAADDAYCPVEQAKWLAEQCKAPIKVLPTGGHLGDDFTELPELWQILELQV